MTKITLSILSLLIAAVVQEPQSPSLKDTFDWIAATLSPQEGNAIYVIKPRFESQANAEKRIDTYHNEIISEFSHIGTKVKFKVTVTDNDMGLLLGLRLEETQVETFDLSDIDPTTVKAVANDCLYCKPDKLQVSFHTRNARPLIHRESVSSSTYTVYEFWQEKHEYDVSRKALCANMPTNEGYCEFRNKSQKPADVTSSVYGFNTSEYAARFAKALQHAIVLSGGKPSSF
jgi:hypothetical protein